MIYVDFDENLLHFALSIKLIQIIMLDGFAMDLMNSNFPHPSVLGSCIRDAPRFRWSIGAREERYGIVQGHQVSQEGSVPFGLLGFTCNGDHW